MPTVRAATFLAACTAIAGCAAPPPKPVAVAPTPASPAVDGTYRGTSTRFQADSRKCPHPGLVTLYVQDRKFAYRWDYSTWVDSSIDPDGTIHGQADRITLVGKRNGTMLEGDVTNGTCGLHFTAKQHDL